MGGNKVIRMAETFEDPNVSESIIQGLGNPTKMIENQ
jgi:hypothetical protein